jgi:hypothetical protein
MKGVEMMVWKQGVAALARKLRVPALSRRLWQIFAQISSLFWIFP